MNEPLKAPILIGNWKMYKTAREAVAFAEELKLKIQESEKEVWLAVPFTAIEPVSHCFSLSHRRVGAQNMNDASEGAYTGEIAARMIKEAGATFVLLGHSERRRFFGETNALINKKVLRAIAEKLTAVLCIGETLEEKESNTTFEVLEKQLRECLQDVGSQDISSLLIAYEPVWAIGTGKIADDKTIQEVHEFCLNKIKELYPKSDLPLVLYGGSVKPDNSRDLLKIPGVGGFLVGGASLSVDSFSKIVLGE